MGSPPKTKVSIPEEVSEPVRAVVELFRGPLEDVSFPDVDGPRLEALVTEVKDRVADVAAARLALDSAQHALDEDLTRLTRAAERAHAYAQIFAQGDEAVHAAVEAISIQPKADGRRRKVASKPKRQNKKRADDLELPLPADASNAEAVH